VGPEGHRRDRPGDDTGAAMKSVASLIASRWEKAPAVAEDHYLVQPRSLAFLVAPTPGGEP
jgi:hypothetical protein